jgi:asparaginyl-tRNA synthetase
MKRTRIKDAVNAAEPSEDILVKGWVRTRRKSKGCSFLEVNDGSCLSNLQVVVEDGVDPEVVASVGTGASVSVRGRLVESPGKGQAWEVQAESVELIGYADPAEYPLQKKRHSDEFLRSIAQLRPRTNKYGAINRIRSEAAIAVHEHFHERGFFHIHTPIITGSDCEGAGELFRVTSQGSEGLNREGDRPERDFFGKKAFLTVSGQLAAEVMACALGNVYTFGPTFRAEDSNTPRHAAEFWMVEPEMAFADLFEAVDAAEDMIRSVISRVRRARAEDLGLFARFVDQELEGRLDVVEQRPFARMAYSEAVRVLERAAPEKRFQYPPRWGADLQTEHERYLADEHWARPVVVYDYPRSIKPFYMRVNDGGETVAAFDVLLPRVGEIVGGGQREERLETLREQMARQGLPEEEYRWYLDLRRYGTVPHAGFGLGFERLLMFMTGVHNIRDVLPFPRTPESLEL